MSECLLRDSVLLELPSTSDIDSHRLDPNLRSGSGARCHGVGVGTDSVFSVGTERWSDSPGSYPVDDLRDDKTDIPYN